MSPTNFVFTGSAPDGGTASLCIADAGHICTSNAIGTTLSNSLEITDVAAEPAGFLLLASRLGAIVLFRRRRARR